MQGSRFRLASSGTVHRTIVKGGSRPKSAVATRSVDLEPIDRLEEKVRLLVGMIGRLRADNAQASEENARLSRELEAARARSRMPEDTSAEVAALREEREPIRARVDDMLEQIERTESLGMGTSDKRGRARSASAFCFAFPFSLSLTCRVSHAPSLLSPLVSHVRPASSPSRFADSAIPSAAASTRSTSPSWRRTWTRRCGAAA